MRDSGFGHRCITGWRAKPLVTIQFYIYPKDDVDEQIDDLEAETGWDRSMSLSDLIRQTEQGHHVEITKELAPVLQSLPSAECTCVEKPT